MRAVVQRVRRGSVAVEGEVIGQCGPGFVVLLGVGQGDSQREADFLAAKLVKLRVFEDSAGKMNLSLLDLQPAGELLVISQFTLYADMRKGRRPGFGGAAAPEIAAPLVNYSLEQLRRTGLTIQTGRFGTDMVVEIVNDGPVTLIMDTAELL